MTPALQTKYDFWRATSAIKFHSRPRTTEVIRPMSPHAYAAELAVRALNASR